MVTALKPIKERVRELKKITLESGGHSGPDAGMCVMEGVAWVYGKQWSDHPECVSPVIGAFLRRWNDDLGVEDRQRLKPYILRVAGTRSTDEVESKRTWLVTDWMVRVHTPAWLDLGGMADQATTLRSLPEITKSSVAGAMLVLNEARRKADAACAAAYGAAYAAAYGAAYAAAYGAAYDAAKAKLAPTVVALQASAFDLLDRLIALE